MASQQRARLIFWNYILYALYLTALVKADDEEEFGMSMDDLVEALTPFGESCDEKPERDNIIELIQNKEDVQMKTKCFRRCMLQQFDIMNENKSQFDEDKLIEMMGMFYPDKEEKSREIIKRCNSEHATQTEKCEAAHALSMCMLREMRANEYKIPEIKR